MNSILSISAYTFLQQIRNRLFLIVILFAVILLAASLLFGALSPDQEVRVILDLGLAVIEIFGLVAVGFGAVVLVLEEIESKTIYLILTRPIPRHHYILGRYAGLVFSVMVSMAGMGLFHMLILLMKGWEFQFEFFLSFPLMFLKIMVISGLGLFFSLFSSSSVVSIIFTFFFWILGHFHTEMAYLADKTAVPLVSYAIEGILLLSPNLEILNYRDFFHVPGVTLAQIPGAVLHSLLYVCACLAMSSAIFAKKEL